jgi:hypothetical protein
MRPPKFPARLLLLLIMLTILLLPSPQPSRAAVGFDALRLTLPPGSDIINITSALMDYNGTIYFLGQRPGEYGVYRLLGGAVEPFLLDGAQIPAQLPSGIGTSVTISRATPWFVDNGGRVFFWIIEAGQTQVTRALRLEVGGGFTLLELGPPGTSFRNETPTSNGRWLAAIREPVEPEDIVVFYRTDGVSAQQLLRRPFRVFACKDGEQSARIIDEAAIQVNAQGEGIVLERLSTSRYPNPDCTGSRPQLTSVGFRISGLNGSTRIEEVLPTTEARLINPRLLQMNDAGQVLYVVLTVTPSGDESYRLMRDSTTILTRSFVGSAPRGVSASFYSAQLQPDGSVVYLVRRDSDPQNPTGGIYRNGALALSGNDPMFGEPVDFVELQKANSRGTIFTQYVGQNSGTIGAVLLAPTLGRWVNAAGGNWGEPTNWAGEDVPGQGASALFDLPNQYSVSTGNRQVGSVEVQAGDLTWEQGRLDIIGALRIGTLDNQNPTALIINNQMQVNVGEVTLGALPTVDTEPFSVLRIDGGGTFTVTGTLDIGQAGTGRLALLGGRLSSGETRFGVGSPGSFVTLGGQWTTGSMLVGERYPGNVPLSSGVSVQSSSARIGGGTLAPEFVPGPGQSAFSRVVVDGVGFDDLEDEDAEDLNPSSWSIAQELEIGSGHPGQLRITDGGSVQARTVTVDNLDTGVFTWSNVLVSGIETNSQRPSTWLIGQDLLLGNTSGAEPTLRINAGGIVDIGRTLSVGHQSDAYPIVFVAGAGTTLTAGQSAGASCSIGFSGGGELNVSAGGDFHCQAPLFVGLGNEDAYLTITGATSRVRAQRLEIGAPASANPAADGILELKSGQLILDQPSTIWENGTLSGNGEIEGDLNVVGTLEPDLIGLDPAPNQLQANPAAGVAQAGALRVTGALTFAPGSRLAVRLTGPGQYGQLDVTGAATLGGTLVLNFSEGYAPEAGDVFQFVRADTSSGAFATVAVTGLAPGWQYTLASDDGVISLTAHTDGVATTTPTRRLYLPIVQR